ncbi:transcription initiation factor iib [Anaeramoeba ignava]|uniref:Transcription initiation factor iib n=1 Tax=Anaeramoeba ignava TaxID=1746090 RepID=A0A9Q0RGN9_ANAIG|nr:transcription initiation factor iib [Anaeramoeba ignava]
MNEDIIKSDFESEQEDPNDFDFSLTFQQDGQRSLLLGQNINPEDQPYLFLGGNERTKSEKNAKEFLHQIIERISNNFNLDDIDQASIKSLLDEVIIAKEMKITVRLEVLAGSCVLFYSRIYHRPISIYDISSEIGCQPSKLTSICQEIGQVLERDFPKIDETNFIERYCNQIPILSLSPNISDNDNLKEKIDPNVRNQIIQETKQLVSYLSKSTTFSGKNPLVTVIGAIYWVSQIHEVKILIDDLEKITGFSKMGIRKRYKEISFFVLEFCKLLPWFNKDIKMISNQNFKFIVNHLAFLDWHKNRVDLRKKSSQNKKKRKQNNIDSFKEKNEVRIPKISQMPLIDQNSPFGFLEPFFDNLIQENHEKVNDSVIIGSDDDDHETGCYILSRENGKNFKKTIVEKLQKKGEK